MTTDLLPCVWFGALVYLLDLYLIITWFSSGFGFRFELVFEGVERNIEIRIDGHEILAIRQFLIACMYLFHLINIDLHHAFVEIVPGLDKRLLPKIRGMRIHILIPTILWLRRQAHFLLINLIVSLFLRFKRLKRRHLVPLIIWALILQRLKHLWRILNIKRLWKLIGSLFMRRRRWQWRK